MNVSYNAVYESYSKFCKMIGQQALPFEDWMHAREDTGLARDKAQEFIKDSTAKAGNN